MSASITLPLWLAIVIGTLAAWALLDRLLMPSARWFIKSRANRVLDEVGRRLKISIRPFQQVKRQALIDAIASSRRWRPTGASLPTRRRRTRSSGAGVPP